MCNQSLVLEPFLLYLKWCQIVFTLFFILNSKSRFGTVLHFDKKSWPLQSSGKGTQQRFQMSAAIPNGYSLIFWIRRIFWNVIFLVNLILWLYSIYFCKSIRCGYERSGLRQSSNFSYIKLQLDIFNLGWKELFHIVNFFSLGRKGT